MSEDELLDILAIIKRQQAAIDKQHQVIEAATATWLKALKDFQGFPQQAIEPLKTATERAVEIGVIQSLNAEKKELAQAVRDAKRDISEAMGELREQVSEAKGVGIGTAIGYATIGGLIGGLLVGSFMWYAVKTRMLDYSITLDAKRVADYISQQFKPAPRR